MDPSRPALRRTTRPGLHQHEARLPEASDGRGQAVGDDTRLRQGYRGSRHGHALGATLEHTHEDGTRDTFTTRAHADRRSSRLEAEIGQARGDDSLHGSMGMGLDGIEAGARGSRGRENGSVRSGHAQGRVGLGNVRADVGIATRHAARGPAPLPDPATGEVVPQTAGQRLTGSQSRTASAGVRAVGDADLRVTAPQPRGDRWVVTYRMPMSGRALGEAGLSFTGIRGGDVGGGDADLAARTGIPGARTQGPTRSARLHAAAGLTGEVSGERVFADEDEAWAWYTMPDPQDLMPPVALSDAAALSPGEHRAARVEGEVGVGVGADAGSLGVSASGSAHAGAGITVEKVGEREVVVTRELGGDLVGQGGVHTHALSVGGYAATGAMGQQRWRLDPTIPAAADAYRALLVGQTPQDGPGVSRLDDRSLTYDEARAQVDAPGASISSGVRATDLEVRRRDGTRRVAERGGHAATMVPWKGFDTVLPRFDQEIGTEAATEYDAEEGERGTGVYVAAHSEGNGVSATHEILGQAFGRDASMAKRRGPAEAGQWQLVVDHGEDAMDRLRARLDALYADMNPSMMLTSVRVLVRDMKAAGDDRAAQRQAIQDFGRHGREATDLIHGWLGRGQAYVGLEDSATWIGIEGHREAENQIARWSTSLDSGTARIDSIQERLDIHRARLNDLRDFGRYLEVPADVRRQEITRTRKLVSRLEALVKEAGGDPGGAGEDPELGRLLATLEERREEVETVYARVRRARDRHGVGWVRTFGKAWGRLGGSGLFGLGAGSEAEAYELAETVFAEAEEHRREAGELEVVGRTALADSSGPINPARPLSEALGHLDQARYLFRDVREILNEIKERHPEFF